MPKLYPRDFTERAIRLVIEGRTEGPNGSTCSFYPCGPLEVLRRTAGEEMTELEARHQRRPGFPVLQKTERRSERCART